MQGTAVAIILSLLQAILAIVIISAAFEGHIYFFGDINKISRIVYFLSGVLILMPLLLSKYIGFGLFAVSTLLIILLQYKKSLENLFK